MAIASERFKQPKIKITYGPNFISVDPNDIYKNPETQEISNKIQALWNEYARPPIKPKKEPNLMEIAPKYGNMIKGVALLGGAAILFYGLSRSSEKVFSYALEKAAKLFLK